MHYLDYKYLALVSPWLRNFKKKSAELFNFSCPFCGDSQHDSRKARGYIYQIKDSSWYFCHNCNIALGFKSFLKRLDSELFSQYRVEKLQLDRKQRTNDLDYFKNEVLGKVIVEDGRKELKKLKKISQLPVSHPAKKIIMERKIPTHYHTILRYTPGFKHFVNTILPKKFDKKSLEKDEGRIIIPFYDKNATLHAFQGRAINQTEHQLRYISIVINETVPCIWGLNHISRLERIFVHEGVFDAMFIPNSLAIAGGNFRSLQQLQLHDCTIIYDNEPRSKETKKKMLEAVEQGFDVCVWPNNIVSKDINEMIVKENLTSDYIKYIIENNTYTGGKAKFVISQWSKV